MAGQDQRILPSVDDQNKESFLVRYASAIITQQSVWVFAQTLLLCSLSLAWRMSDCYCPGKMPLTGLSANLNSLSLSRSLSLCLSIYMYLSLNLSLSISLSGFIYKKIACLF